MTQSPMKKKKTSNSNFKCMADPKQAKQQLVINTWNTVYEVVSEQSAMLGYKEKKVDPGLQATPNYWYDQPQTGLSKMASSAGA